jgi:hypothetical protein
MQFAAMQHLIHCCWTIPRPWYVINESCFALKPAPGGPSICAKSSHVFALIQSKVWKRRPTSNQSEPEFMQFAAMSHLIYCCWIIPMALWYVINECCFAVKPAPMVWTICVKLSQLLDQIQSKVWKSLTIVWAQTEAEGVCSHDTSFNHKYGSVTMQLKPRVTCWVGRELMIIWASWNQIRSQSNLSGSIQQYENIILLLHMMLWCA